MTRPPAWRPARAELFCLPSPPPAPPRTARACTAEDCPRVWIHHYFTRSREDWTHKVKRGDRGGFPRKMEDFDAWDAKSIANCTRGLEAFAKFLPEGLSTTHF